MQVAGIMTIKADGKLLRAKSGIKFMMGGYERTAITAGGSVMICSFRA